MKKVGASLMMVLLLFLTITETHARYYDPKSGRFTTKDPIGYQGGVNKYVYARNNPVNYKDPTGEVAIFDDLVLIGLIGLTGIAAIYYYYNPPIVPTMPIKRCSDEANEKGGNESDKSEMCYNKCKHLLPSPSGDLQASEYRKCYRECMGSLK